MALFCDLSVLICRQAGSLAALVPLMEVSRVEALPGTGTGTGTLQGVVWVHVLVD